MLTDRADMRHALRELHRRRLQRRIRQLDWVDALYKAYVTGILGLTALFGAAALLGDDPLASSTVRDITDQGPAAIGVAVALGILLGLRSGSHGGPLAFEAPDVAHVMLSPIDRDLVVRSAAYRQARGVGAVAAVGGALAGVLIVQRLPGTAGSNVAEWVIAGIAAGILTALLVWGAALVASGSRWSGAVAAAVGVALVAWSVLDLAAGVITSPASWVGAVALFPLEARPGVVVAVLAAAVVTGAGLWRAGGLSLEAAQRRAGLVNALRFAATIQDLRVVILLHRQLAHEHARSRPWLRMRPAAPVGRACWRRDWHGILRWPAARVGRVAALGIVAGLAAAFAARGTTPLLVVAGLAAYVVGLDAVEGLAQEIDHPERALGFPAERGALYVRHLAAAGAVAGFAGALGWLAAIAVDPGYAAVGGITVVAVATLTVTCAALAVYLAAPEITAAVTVFHPGFGMARQVVPPLVVVAGFAPVLVAREAAARPEMESPVGAAVGVAVLALLLAFGIVAFLGRLRTVAR